ncbi:hypothetical protein HAX54_046438 [Datura stramonium]|uniref:Uncharacterized protein n=1 Tax=Datura stramonium TaxID=4076 RepID=A0ABS8WH16_DATST|nr:hypothetical protein [Datura stramonium]
MRWERVAVHGGGGPGKRWGHTCNAVQGGTATVVTTGAICLCLGAQSERESLNDLHILDTSLNTWMSPCQRGDRPTPREGHSAALIGKRLFIFGGCGNFRGAEIFYDDVYVLNTETLVWKRIVPSGIPPSKRESHSCSSWNGKIIIIGGQDTSNFYQSDVHILDTEPIYDATCLMLLLVHGVRSCLTGEGPSARFSVAGDCLDPHSEAPSCLRRHNIYLNEYQTPLGKKTFQFSCYRKASRCLRWEFTRNEASVGDATAEMKSPFPSYASSAHEVHDMSHDVNLESSMVTDAIDCGTKVSKENASATNDL